LPETFAQAWVHQAAITVPSSSAFELGLHKQNSSPENVGGTVYLGVNPAKQARNSNLVKGLPAERFTPSFKEKTPPHK